MISWIFFSVATIGLLLSVSTWVQARQIGPFSFPYFMGAWVTGELALQTIAWQAVATVLFAIGGAFEEAPGVVGLAGTFLSWSILLASWVRSLGSGREIATAAAPLGLELGPVVPLLHGLSRPFRMKRPGVRWIRDVSYGPSLPGDKGRRNMLDVVLPDTPIVPEAKRPMLLQIHGGGWVYGDKERQGQPLMAELASRGWVCFAINYRLCPKATFLDLVVDVKRAIAFIREHALEYGGDPDFLAVTGGSAGGHLSALMALSAGDPLYQPGFEEADTSIQACVPFYGVYDFLDRAGIRGKMAMRPFLEKQVFKCSPEEQPELWDAASPLNRVSAEAPPFFVIHGSHDSLVFVEEARLFVRVLREKSGAAVGYLEMEGAQHAFDTFHSHRSAQAVRAAAAFLDTTWQAAQTRQ
jgi:acetyl esterase/lipase